MDEFKVVKNRILSQIINDKVTIKFRVLKKQQRDVIKYVCTFNNKLLYTQIK